MILERQPLMDDWEDAMQPLLSKYSASFEVEYDQDYFIKVGILLQCIQNSHDRRIFFETRTLARAI